jgi:hypothetical protein
VNTITVLDQPGISFTNSVGGNQATIYTIYNDGTPNPLGGVGAHEAGHLMGDLDRYTTLPKVSIGGVSIPTIGIEAPGYQNNIMANLNGLAAEGNIGAIINCAASNCYQPGAGGGGARSPFPSSGESGPPLK